MEKEGDRERRDREECRERWKEISKNREAGRQIETRQGYKHYKDAALSIATSVQPLYSRLKHRCVRVCITLLDALA
jgi:hypothetical protein